MAEVPADFRCTSTGKALYLPVITTQGVAYSYAALFEMFMEAGGRLPECKSTQEPIAFFPHVCLPLHHFMFAEYPKAMKARKEHEEAEMREKYGFQLPAVTTAPDFDGDEGLLEELECQVTKELAFNPCVLSSGSIVSAHAVPEPGFRKDPNRLIGCALHGQRPRKAPVLEALMRERFPQEYLDRGEELDEQGVDLEGQFATGTWTEFATDQDVFFGLGCDGCGQWPIRGEAWEDVECREDKTGFHLCGPCYHLGYHKRVTTGKFNQTRLPPGRLEFVIAGNIM